MDPEPRGGAKAEAAAVKATKMTVRYIMVRRLTWKAVFIASGQVASKGSKDGSRDPSPAKKQPNIKFLGREDLFIERTTPQAPTKPNTRKPARLAIV